MKKYIIIEMLLIVVSSYVIFATEPAKIVHDNTGGVSAQITFQAQVVKLLRIETSTLVLNIGPLVAGETKILGESYSAVFHLTGVANSKFVINLLNENFSNDGVTLEGLKWGFKNSQLSDYSQIMTFPYISQLNQENGDGWIKVYPESIKTDQDIDKTLINFEFKFNCSYYEL